MKKLKSRKLWVSIGAAVLAIVGDAYGVSEEILKYAIGALGVYVGVEGLVDFAAVPKGIKEVSPKS